MQYVASTIFNNAALAGLLAFLLIAPQQANASNLVVNGDFETGDLTGWTLGDGAGWQVFSGTGILPSFSGQEFVSSGCSIGFCTLQQSLITQPGATYDLSFAFNPGPDANSTVSFGPLAGRIGGDTQVLWNGNIVLDLAGGDEGWQVFNASGLTATSNSTLLSFSGYQFSTENGLDEVSVTGATTPSAVPLPPAWIMMLSSLAVLLPWRLLRTKKTS